MGYCSLETVTAATAAPLTVAEVKAHLRIDHDDDDDLLTGYILVAVARTQQVLNRALLTQTLRYTVSPDQPPPATAGGWVNPIIFVPPPIGWGSMVTPALVLPMPPVQSVTGVVTRARDGTVTTLTAGQDYYADLVSGPGRISLLGGGQAYLADMIVTYVAGMGDAADAVPIDVRHAMKLLLGWMYEHRGDDDGEPPKAYRQLLAPHRVLTFGG